MPYISTFHAMKCMILSSYKFLAGEKLMETNISQALDITSERAKYDESIKEILADKQILARILKYTLDEFENLELDTIIANIDEPEISRVRIEPGHTNTEKIKKCAEEDNVPGEGKIFFDIRFSVYHGPKQIKVLINIEAQKSSRASKLGYHLDNRIIYYLSRMISAQKEVEFNRSDYDDLKAVRSIWICMDAADDEDSINRIVLSQDTVFGRNMDLTNLSKVQGVIIRLRSNENSEVSKNTLIAMLEELLKKESAEIKKKRLSENFGLVMDAETERRMDIMCNLSEVMIEQGIEKGIEKGIEAFIADKLEDEVSSDIIIHKLEKRFNLSNDKACEYLRKYSESITEKSD